MNFIEAVIAISQRDDLQFCDDTAELEGKHPSICVYRQTVFVGKLRWPNSERKAAIDKELQSILEERSNGQT